MATEIIVDVKSGEVQEVEFTLPPTILPSKSERIAIAFAVYDATRTALERELAVAINEFQDSEYAALILGDLATLDNDYTNEVGAIMNG